MLVNYFLILIFLLLVSGLVVDAGLLEWRQISLQTAADAAAQEGMYEKARNDSAWATAAQAQATQNGFANGVNGVTVSVVNPPTSGINSGDSASIQATVSQTVHNIFMGLVNGGTSTVSAVAVAKVLPTCMWIMGSTGTTSNPSLKLSSAGMRPSCGVYVNTSTGYNLGVDYFSDLVATRIRVLGSSTNNQSSGTVSPTPRFGAAKKNDPLAYVTAPVFSSCTYTNLSASSGTYTVAPGTYCGMSVSNSTLNFNPGLYIITGGLSVSNSTLNGSGVTIYFTQGGGYGYGTVSFTAIGMFMSAPTSSSGGGIPGVLIFGDRNWIAHNSQSISVNNSTITSDGFWYVLNTGISASNTAFSGTNYMGFVVDNWYQYLGNTNGSANYAPLSNVSPLHHEDGTLVQ